MVRIEAGEDENNFRPPGAHFGNVQITEVPIMKKLPSFLKISMHPCTADPRTGVAGSTPYLPLLGLWLIDMALASNWINKPPAGDLTTTFCDSDYLQVTGLKGMEKLFPEHFDGDEELQRLEEKIAALEDEELELPKARHKSKRMKLAQIKVGLRKTLLRRRNELLQKSVDANLPLFQNVERAGRLLHLNEAERAILTFAACMSCFTVFRNALVMSQIRVTDSQLAQLLSALTGQPFADIRKAIHRGSVLMTAGLVKLDHDEADLEDKIRINRGLRDVFLEQLSSDEELSSRVLRLASPGKLSLGAFPHLRMDIDLMTDYLNGVLREKATGSNILLYGPPGCGKTELAKALAQRLGITLYEIAYADDDGDPIDGEQRLKNFNFCQHALKGKANVALMFDEMEDVLSGDGQMQTFFGLLNGMGQSPRSGKAWINRALEESPVPTIWITNDTDIDVAYLRRFTYSLRLGVPPRQVRTTITEKYLADYSSHTDQLRALAELDDLLPSQLEMAAKVVKYSSRDRPDQAWLRIEQSLMRSRELLGQPRVSLKPKFQTAYSLDFIRSNADIPSILNGLRRSPHATFCLYGPPGTGKSLLARHVADELGVPLLQKRASDLLDKYVGETEQRIAAMFEQARDEGAVLVLDEADSFLSDRTGAQRQWELTQTNEFLTRLESFEGIFFATTNLIDKLDSAVLRRFSHKIKFDYLTADQRWCLFEQEALRLGIAPHEITGLESKVRRLELLTPGDFAAVIKNLKLSAAIPSAAAFHMALESEVSIKRHGKETIGFI